MDRSWPGCGQAMIVRHDTYGAFLGCTSYPTYRRTGSLARSQIA